MRRKRSMRRGSLRSNRGNKSSMRSGVISCRIQEDKGSLGVERR